MDNIRHFDPWRVTLQTTDADNNAQAPDSPISVGSIRVYVNGVLSAVPVTVATLGDIVGGHAISWPNTTSQRGAHLRMQIPFTVDSIDYEARFEAIVEISPLSEDVSGIFSATSLGSLLIGIYNNSQSGLEASQSANSQIGIYGTYLPVISENVGEVTENQALLSNEIAEVPGLVVTAINADATQTAARAAAATAAAQATAAATNSARAVTLGEADLKLEFFTDVYMLGIYERQTNTLLLPRKTALQQDGSPLTNVETQRLAGFQEE